MSSTWLSALVLFALGIASPGIANAQLAMGERTTHCLGRFLLELPVNARVQARFSFADADVTTHRTSDDRDFRERVETRERALRAIRHARNGSLFVAREDFDPQHVSLTSWNGPSSRRVYRYDMYAYRPDQGVVFELTGLGAATEQARTTALEYQRELLSRSIRYRADGDIPREPGFCIDAGFIARSVLNGEAVSADVTLPGYPGVTVSFMSSVTGRPDVPLLERVSTMALGGDAIAARMTTIRRGSRRVDTAVGQELLVRGDGGGMTAYEFLWEYQGQANALEAPFLSLRLSTTPQTDERGGVIDTPFASDEDALAFWDALLSTLRLRPGAVNPKRPAGTSSMDPTHGS